jgi:hypothetical protein
MDTRKLLIPLLLACATQALALDSRFQSITEQELIGYGDFDGDGVIEGVLVDRASGAVRVLRQVGGGDPQWLDPIPSGLESADSFSVGPILAPGADQLAVGGLLPNRTHVLALDAPFPAPQAVFTSGAGHRDVAAVDLALAGNDPSRMELVVVTGWPGDAPTQAIFQSTAGGFSAFSEGTAPAAIRAHARVRLLQNGQDYILFLEDYGTPGFERAVLGDPLQPASPPVDVEGGIHAGSRYIHGPLLNGNACQFVFYRAGEAAIQVCTTQPGSLLQPPVEHTLAAPGGSLHLVRDAASYGFLAISADGASATLYQLDGSGAPVPVDSFAAGEGSRLSGALSLAPGQLTLLLGPAAGGPSDASVHFVHDGGDWVESGQAALPPIGPLLALPNVLTFAGEPFVNPSAALTQAIHIPDWTRDLSFGAGNAVSVVAESFSGSGLRSPSVVSAGTAPAGSTHGWTNQYGPTVSLSALRAALGPQAPALSFDPLPGTYSRYTEVRISAAQPLAVIHYRIGESGPWLSAAGEAVIIPPNGTLSPFTVYAFVEYNGVRSPVATGHYMFHSPAGPLDSDGDGVPDYVELEFGVSPLAGADSDGDGYSDLQELLAGTDVGDREDFPSSWARLASPAVFNVALRPLSFDTFSTVNPDRPSHPASANPADPAATTLRAYDIEGRLLASAMTGFYPEDAFGGVSAWLPSLPAEPPDTFVVVFTDPTFPIQFDNSILDASGERADDRGVELVGLVPVPRLQLDPVPYTPPDGISSTDAASAWLAAASAHYAGQSVAQVEQLFTYLDTLKLLLAERMFALLIAQRDPGFDPDTFSLTPMRDPAGGTPPDSALLLDLQQPGPGGEPAHRLQAVFEQVSQAVDAPPVTSLLRLRDLARELYHTAGTLTAAEPGMYPSVVDTLRAFIRGEALPGTPGASYAAAASLTAQQLQQAQSAPAGLFAQLAPRPQVVFSARVTGNSYDEAVPELVQFPSSLPLRLLDAAGDPFPFPPGLQLLPDTVLSVLAFNDRADPPFVPNQAVETISVSVVSLPRPVPLDANQNGLPDDWELLFAGQGSLDPFADSDGDGVSDLEEFLRRTHPLLAGSAPADPILPLGRPQVRMQQLPNGNFGLRILFPSDFAQQVGFRLQFAEDLGSGFFESIGIAEPDSEGTFSLQIAPPPGFDAQFYRFRLFLR